VEAAIVPHLGTITASLAMGNLNTTILKQTAVAKKKNTVLTDFAVLRLYNTTKYNP